MKRLFLSSSFADVVSLLKQFDEDNCEGKTVTFIATASIPEKVKFYVGAGKKALEKNGFVVDELEISQATAEDISQKLRHNDYIYVSGGNTFFLLQELKRTGADKIIVEQINAGKLYIGESAGSMILSPNIEYAKEMDDYKIATGLDSYDALHVVEFYPVPHYTNSPFKKAVEKIISKYEAKITLNPISNSQAILVKADTVVIVNK